jgi:proline dehydrogenase
MPTPETNFALPTIDFSNTEIAFAHKSNAEIKKAYWLFKLMNNTKLVNFGTPFLTAALSLHLPIKWAIKGTIFKQFCGGENIEQCTITIKELGKYHVGAILDYSVEGEKNEKAFDATCEETIATIRKAAAQPNIPFSVFKVTGLAPFSLLEKKQAGTPLNDEEKAAWDRVYDRVNRICAMAAEMQVRIFFDGEETWIQETIDSLCYEMMEKYNGLMPIVFNTYQIYRWEALPNLKVAVKVAEEKGYFFGAKLVRGAYMEKERARAQAMGYKDPIQPNKQATDSDYDAAMLFCLDHLHFVSFCAGTHNENSSKLLAMEMLKRGIDKGDERIYFSQLLGMSDNISFTLAKLGFNVAKYVPYGPVASVMPYLVRRARENTSIAGQSSREFNLIEKELERRSRAN